MLATIVQHGIKAVQEAFAPIFEEANGCNYLQWSLDSPSSHILMSSLAGLVIRENFPPEVHLCRPCKM